MKQEVHFENNWDREVKTPDEGATVWVDYHPYHDSVETLPLPVACLKVYEDGSWDGMLEEGEA